MVPRVSFEECKFFTFSERTQTQEKQSSPKSWSGQGFFGRTKGIYSLQRTREREREFGDQTTKQLNQRCSFIILIGFTPLHTCQDKLRIEVLMTV
jgi:hypothetical protein